MQIMTAHDDARNAVQAEIEALRARLCMLENRLTGGADLDDASIAALTASSGARLPAKRRGRRVA